MDSIKVESFTGNTTRDTIKIGKDDCIKVIYCPANVDKALFRKALKKNKDKEKEIIKSKHNYVYFKKGKYLWSVVWNNIWGYIVTALFISLGAPFWFDLLNKIVKLRTSVAQGTSSVHAKKSGKNTNNDDTSTLKRKG